MTFRPEFSPPWAGQEHVTTLPLNRLSRGQAVTMIDGVANGKKLPAEVQDQILSKTDGVPLFVEELTKSVLESELLREEGDAYVLATALTPLAIPSTLHDSLTARLDRLSPIKEIAQIGAAIGREFSQALLEAIAPVKGAALNDVLRQLIEAELIYRRGTPPKLSYVFKHALVQDAAYASLLAQPPPAHPRADRRGAAGAHHGGGKCAGHHRASFHRGRARGARGIGLARRGGARSVAVGAGRSRTPRQCGASAAFRNVRRQGA